MKDAYYFSHDSNAKDDPKCMMLIEQLGLEGYGIFWVLVETLRDQPNYKYPLKLLPAIARRYNTTFEKVKTVVLNYELFSIENDDFFFSKSLNERMKAVNLSRISGIKGSLKRHGYLTNEQLQNMSDTQILDYHTLVKNRDVSPLDSPLGSTLLPIKEKEKKEKEKKEKSFPSEIINFTGSLSKNFPLKIVSKLTPKQKGKWLDTVDKLIRIDGYDKNEIQEIVIYFRNDDFWKDNFMSINKLREKNKSGVKYIDFFSEKLKTINKANPRKRTSEERKQQLLEHIMQKENEKYQNRKPL
jgi:hypothetical protein